MSFLLLEDGSRLLQENGGSIILDLDFADVSQVNLGDFTALTSYQFGDMIALSSLNLEDFMVIADG